MQMLFIELLKAPGKAYSVCPEKYCSIPMPRVRVLLPNKYGILVYKPSNCDALRPRVP